MGLSKTKRKEISNTKHFRDMNAQIMGERTENYDPFMDGQRNLDSAVYRDRALNYNISGKQLFDDENKILDLGIAVERQKMVDEIQKSKTHRSEKTRKSRMADAAKAAKQASIFKSNAEKSQNSMSPLEIHQANTKVNLSHYKMQENFAKAMAKSQDEEDLLIDNAKRAFLIREMRDIINAKIQVSDKEREKLDSPLKKAAKEYTKILVKTGEMKEKDAILYELNPELIFEEFEVKKELSKGPETADDKGVELSEYLKNIDISGLCEMNNLEIANNFSLIQKAYLYAKHARENTLQADDEINTSSKGNNIKFKMDFLENLYRKSVFVKSGMGESNKNYKAVSERLKGYADSFNKVAHKKGISRTKKAGADLLFRTSDEEIILKERERDMRDFSIDLKVSELLEEAEENPVIAEEQKCEHYHNLMRFDVDAMANLSDDDLLLKYEDLKRLAALGKIYSGETLNNKEFDNYKYKKQNIRTRMEMVETLCARASLLNEGKHPEDTEVKASRTKIDKLAKRYRIYRREFLRNFILNTELDPIEDYVPDSELKVPKDIMEMEKKCYGKNPDEIKIEYEKRKNENADPEELDLLQYAIFQKTYIYSLAGGVKPEEGFEEDRILTEPFFRAGIHHLFRTPVFKDMNGDEIRELAYGLSAGITLPTYDEVKNMKISDKEKEELTNEINEARNKNLAAFTTFVEKTEELYNYVANIVGTDVLSPEFLMIHKNDFESFKSFGQVIRGVLRHKALRGLIGKESGDILLKKADFIGLLTTNALNVYKGKSTQIDNKGNFDINLFNKNIDTYDKFGVDFKNYYINFYYSNNMYKDGIKTILGKE